MNASGKPVAGRNSPDAQEVREQEVLRANRELAAYFKGRRTEREARAALKIVKAFIRDRERLDPAKRRPLPGAAETETRPPKKTRRRKTAGGSKARRRKAREAPAPAIAMSDQPIE